MSFFVLLAPATVLCLLGSGMAIWSGLERPPRRR
jgi:hypothetical protein